MHLPLANSEQDPSPVAVCLLFADPLNGKWIADFIDGEIASRFVKVPREANRRTLLTDGFANNSRLQ